MGILDKIFGSSSSDDDKYILMVNYAMLLSASDGNAEEVEGQVLRDILSQVPGMNEDRFTRIVQTAMKNMENRKTPITPEEARSMSLDDKKDIISALVAVSMADGKFHGEELVFICMAAASLELDVPYLVDHLMKNYDIDENEITVASERTAKWMKENGYA
tara:strand:+ start:124 stop:606 length:483 start_codon:yes stop_codon:yes gene_type:complete